NSWAARVGSTGLLVYFNTDPVGRTARFRSDVRRVMMASVMPMPQDSSPALSESPRNGSTARVVGFGCVPCEGCSFAAFGRVQYPPARAAANIKDATPADTSVCRVNRGRC